MSIPPSRVTQPPEAVALVERLRLLRHERCEQIHIAAAGSGPKGLRVRRRALSRSDRATIAAKTDGRCHICGGVLDTAWEADHVLAHSGGGGHRLDNYLAAHSLCNNYRWNYSPEEFQWVLKIGVWARLVIEHSKPLGVQMAARFSAYEDSRARRRK